MALLRCLLAFTGCCRAALQLRALNSESVMGSCEEGGRDLASGLLLPLLLHALALVLFALLPLRPDRESEKVVERQRKKLPTLPSAL